MSVGVMKDYKLKLRDLRASQTLGWSWNWSGLYLQSWPRVGFERPSKVSVDQSRWARRDDVLQNANNNSTGSSPMAQKA